MPLTWKQADEAVNNIFKYLDTLKLMPSIDKFKGDKLEDLMDMLEDNFHYEDKYSEKLFDCVTEYEFADYLNKRYGLHIREVTTSYYQINI